MQTFACDLSVFLRSTDEWSSKWHAIKTWHVDQTTPLIPYPFVVVLLNTLPASGGTKHHRKGNGRYVLCCRVTWVVSDVVFRPISLQSYRLHAEWVLRSPTRARSCWVMRHWCIHPGGIITLTDPALFFGLVSVIESNSGSRQPLWCPSMSLCQMIAWCFRLIRPPHLHPTPHLTPPSPLAWVFLFLAWKESHLLYNAQQHLSELGGVLQAEIRPQRVMKMCSLISYCQGRGWKAVSCCWKKRPRLRWEEEEKEER